MVDSSVYIHPSSIVEEGAEVGNGTKIWHFCHLMPGARVGENCHIGQNVFIDNGSAIGNGVRIQNNVSVYNGVIISDDVFIGPSVVFTNVINPRSFINRRQEFKDTIVQKGATIGANATVLCGIEIGEYAMIGAGAVITHDVPAYAQVQGVPARQSGWVSRSGHKLVFDTGNNAVCSGTGENYKLENNRVFPIS
jgi:UDP-2-acetamido-3-amino-2,3-dideoxy-glucuronate N-acetyltransferase